MGTYVRLRVASEIYAMPVGHVVEVADLGEVTPVPGSPPELLGVRNLRGAILPVVDLALLLGITRVAPCGLMVVAEAGGQQAGFAVDDVSEVGTIPEPTEDAESGLLTGAALVNGSLIGVIDVPRAFEFLEGAAMNRPA